MNDLEKILDKIYIRSGSIFENPRFLQISNGHDF